jgi:hypothetical protein
MEILFDRSGAERKALVTAISEITGNNAKYMGAPSFEYRVGYYIITRDGTLDVCSEEDISSLLAALKEREIVPLEMPETTDTGIEEPVSVTSVEESSEPSANVTDVMAIEVPAEGFTDLAYENLSKLIAGKATLIRKAAAGCIADGAGTLPITRDDEKIYFPWFRFGMKPDEVKAWSCFVRALCTAARKQKRVLLKEKPLEDGTSEKFAMRCYLLKLGFIGDEYKTARKVILEGLPGNGSYAKKAAGVRARTDEGRDCLSCAQSVSEPAENDSEHDRLYCVERQDYVEDDNVCAEYNQ